MDLCNSETLAALMAQPQARHKGVARMTRKGVVLSAVYVPPAHKARNRGCKCGQCSHCREYAVGIASFGRSSPTRITTPKSAIGTVRHSVSWTACRYSVVPPAS